MTNQHPKSLSMSINELMYSDDTPLVALFTFGKSMVPCDMHPAKLPRNSIAGWV